MKRSFDILFAILFILFFWWVYIVAYIGIKLSSKGPVIYKAKRVGLQGKEITVYKFRSMRVDSGEVRLTTLTTDERIFPFGAILRKTKIDETPQIFNVLIGNMSVVGPRPEDIDNASRIYVGDYREILSIKPGLTSPASLYDYAIGEECDNLELYEKVVLPTKLDIELFYVRNSNFIYDMEIICRTAITIFQKIIGETNLKVPKEYFIVRK